MPYQLRGIWYFSYEFSIVIKSWVLFAHTKRFQIYREQNGQVIFIARMNREKLHKRAFFNFFYKLEQKLRVWILLATKWACRRRWKNISIIIRRGDYDGNKTAKISVRMLMKIIPQWYGVETSMYIILWKIW